MEEKVKRKPIWNEENTQTVIDWWPHWGIKKVAEMVGLTRQQVKSKVDKLKLKMLPQQQRLCICCKKNKQRKRAYGFLCRKCFLTKRQTNRSLSEIKPIEEWMGDLLRTLKYRSKKRHNQESDLDLQFLLSLWEYQQGKCFYSNNQLKEPSFYRRGRSLDVASIDRLNPELGYIKGNVVWCCWGCNIAKLDFSVLNYIELCGQIAQNKPEIETKLKLDLYNITKIKYES